MHFSTTLSTLTLLLSTLSSLTSSSPISNLSPRANAVSTIYQYPNPTWIENLAVRANGKILANEPTPYPRLHQIDPKTKTSELIHQFPGVTSLFGIAEISHDIFAVIGGNFSLTSISGTKGSYSVWKVDMNAHKPMISKIANIKSAVLLNGMAALLPSPYALPHSGTADVLISDSTLGAVYYLNTSTGSYKIVQQVKNMAPVSSVPIGINGLHILGSELFYANTYKSKFWKVPISLKTGEATGEYELVSKKVGIDDFAIAEDGVVYGAGNSMNEVYALQQDGSYSVIAGGLNSTVTPGPTSAALGRGCKREEGILYVSTSGGLAAPINGTYTEGGKIVAIEL